MCISSKIVYNSQSKHFSNFNTQVQKMKQYSILVSLFFLFSLHAQNELYISGDSDANTIELFVSGYDNTNPTLYVAGEIKNVNGVLKNIGSFIKLTGDFTNTTDGVNSFYESTGVENFSGASSQRISGILLGENTTNNLYNLQIDKSTGAQLSLADTVHVKNSISFVNNGGIIRSDTISHNDDGDLYANELVLLNTSPSSFISAASSANEGNNYIEGKLRWKVDGLNTYLFPVGVEPGSLDAGTQPISLNFTRNASVPYDVLVYLEDGALPLSVNIVYDDIGSGPNGAGVNSILDCTGGVDGALDQIVLDRNQNHQWVVEASPLDTVEYSITVFPSTTADISALNAGIYGCEPVVLRYLAKNGVVGGDLSTSTMSGTVDFPGQPGYALDPTGNTLSGQTSFSTFRLHSTNPGSSTLPVELLSFYASVKSNCIQLDWSTASELNNAGFEVLRSIDAVSFEKIAFLNGQGNSTNIHSYDYLDCNIQRGLLYYYQLKQIDFNGEYSHSDIVSASLKDLNADWYAWLQPNPIKENATLFIQSNRQGLAELKVFNQVGKLITKENIMLQSSDTGTMLNLNPLAPGVYFISLKLNEKTLNQKLLIN